MNSIKVNSTLNINNKEIFRFLRCNLLSIIDSKKILAITSIEKKEGKTFISFNSALSFAEQNYKTLFIDFNFRENDYNNEFFNSKDILGLNDYLHDKCDISEIIYETDISNLFIAPKGLLNDNIIINEQKCNLLFDTLKNQYDIIIIDTPAIGIYHDAFIIGKHSDALALVIKYETVNKDKIKKIITDLKINSCNTVGFITNQI